SVTLSKSCMRIQSLTGALRSNWPTLFSGGINRYHPSKESAATWRDLMSVSVSQQERAARGETRRNAAGRSADLEPWFNVQEVREMAAKGLSGRSVAKEAGISEATVRRILRSRDSIRDHRFLEAVS